MLDPQKGKYTVDWLECPRARESFSLGPVSLNDTHRFFEEKVNAVHLNLDSFRRFAIKTDATMNNLVHICLYMLEASQRMV